MTPPYKGEEWAWVSGHEGAYEVSNLGNVKSVERFVTDENGKTRHYMGRTLSKSNDSEGYPTVSVSGEKVRVHRLVADAFCKRPSGKDFVNHIDGNKQNNSAVNLEWVTSSENNAHAYANGLKPRPFGNRHRALFTDEQVRSIRSDKRNVMDIACEYGVTGTAIRNIQRFKTYKEVV